MILPYGNSLDPTGGNTGGLPQCRRIEPARSTVFVSCPPLIHLKDECERKSSL